MAICYGRLSKSSTGHSQERYSKAFDEAKDALLRLDMQAAAAVDEAL